MSTPSNFYDTVVVGAGFTGALVAHQLAEAAQNVVVLEARSAPGSEAKRSVGLALLGTPEPYASLMARAGENVGRQIWELTRQNLELLTAALQKAHQEATPVGSFRITADEAEAALLQESALLLRQDLYAAEIDDATAQGYLVGLRTADDRAFDPAALISALLDHPNITVEYETEVQAIKQTGRGAETGVLSVWARKHYLQAQTVILANGAYAARLNANLAGIISPLAMHAIDFHNSTALPTPLIIRRGQVVVQARGADWRMAGWNNADQDALPILTAVARQLCPEATATARHSWWVAQSADGLPVVGPAPDMPNVYTVNGLGPWGWSWACIAVDRLIGALLHGEKLGLLGIDRLLAA